MAARKLKTVNRIVSLCVAKLQYAENPKPRNYAIRLDAISKASLMKFLILNSYFEISAQYCSGMATGYKFYLPHLSYNLS